MDTMTLSTDTRRILQSLFGGAFHPPRFRVQPDHDHPVVYATHITEPFTLIACPRHSNHALTALVGLLGRDKDGAVCAEEIRHVHLERR